MANINVQNASSGEYVPDTRLLQLWCERALLESNKSASLAIRIVDADEMLTLNSQFRQQHKTTNVLSFPCQLPAELELHELGDVIVCASVVAMEASAQNKSADAHWAHMIVHGSLHLQGFDHVDEQDALTMEALEEKIITELGFPPPYTH